MTPNTARIPPTPITRYDTREGMVPLLVGVLMVGKTISADERSTFSGVRLRLHYPICGICPVRIGNRHILAVSLQDEWSTPCIGASWPGVECALHPTSWFA